ncbi:MAG: glycosyltransferase [Candidatus Omnitrophota bacterium]|nr:glycosyltransferase [Candidatus Omnitrophota bacterium]
MKKVFIVYASAGAGHQKAAEALYEYLKKTRLDLSLKLIDILDYSNCVVKFLYSKGYIFLITKFPWAWYLLYRLSSFFANNYFRLLSDYLACQPFVDLLKKEKPDVVISTHFLTSSVLSIFKKKYPQYAFRLITIITDYTLHPYWIGEGVDTYIASCDHVKDCLLTKGIIEDKIKVYGIPVREKFYLPSDRKTAAQKLGVDPEKFTALIMTGAVGIGPIEEIVQALAGDIQLLVICGKNQKLFDRLTKLNLMNVKIYPLIDYVDELMSVSDVVLTKAGGLTISESLAKGLPMIFFSSIPGLETSNERVICKSGAGIKVESVEEIKNSLLSLKSNSAAYQGIKQKVTHLKKVATLKDLSMEIPS